jgi:hypothetical protein
MTKKLRVLVLTNEHFIDSAPGQKDAIRILAEQDFIDSVQFVSHTLSPDEDENFRQVLTAFNDFDFDVLLIWSPKRFPRTRDQFETLVLKIKGRPVYYWEGDPWSITGIKTLPEQSKWWAGESQIIFSVAKEPHTTIFRSVSQAKISFIPHTYCHIQFANQEVTTPKMLTNSKAVVMIGSQSAKIPFVHGPPSSGIRFLVGTSLKLRLGRDFQLFGNRWPRGFSSGTVDYSQQAKLIREFSLSANWDNFVNHESYASDRLPISLLAGRAHVTSSHPGINHYGGEDAGLVLAEGLWDVHRKIDEIRQFDPSVLFDIGLEGHKWCRNRFSHREAARFMFSFITNAVPKLSIEPWKDL